MTTTVESAMKDNNRQFYMGAAIVFSVLVYLAGLGYAGVRTYTLFRDTVEAEFRLLALLGIIALEISALALPVAIHFWTAPGSQRSVALIFYGADLVLIAGNAILDAARHSGTLLPEFMSAYGTFGVPALPIFCMVGWALIWMLDPTSQERDMIASVRAGARKALLSSILKAAGAADVSEQVQDAAHELVGIVVGETLGTGAGRRNGHNKKVFASEKPGPNA
mgnify:CR=1 FL=1